MYSSDLHCPYPNCNLYCRNKSVHKAKFAAMYYRRNKRKTPELDEPRRKSSRINYELAKEVLGIVIDEMTGIVIDPADMNGKTNTNINHVDNISDNTNNININHANNDTNITQRPDNLEIAIL